MTQREQELAKTYLPMSEPCFLLLLFLQEPRHGYAIMQQISEATGGRVVLGSSTVYTILYRMEQDGLIRVVSEEERRKVYRATESGRQLLYAEMDRLDSLLRLAVQMTEQNISGEGKVCSSI